MKDLTKPQQALLTILKKRGDLYGVIDFVKSKHIEPKGIWLVDFLELVTKGYIHEIPDGWGFSENQ